METMASIGFSAVTIMNSQITNCTALRHQVAHEIGHTMGLDDICSYGGLCYSEGATIMDNRPPKINPDGSVSTTESDLDNTTYGRNSPSDCDNEVIRCKVYQIPPCPTPTPTPTPYPTPGLVAINGAVCRNPINNLLQIKLRDFPKTNGLTITNFNFVDLGRKTLN